MLNSIYIDHSLENNLNLIRLRLKLITEYLIEINKINQKGYINDSKITIIDDFISAMELNRVYNRELGKETKVETFSPEYYL